MYWVQSVQESILMHCANHVPRRDLRRITDKTAHLSISSGIDIRHQPKERLVTIDRPLGHARSQSLGHPKRSTLVQRLGVSLASIGLLGAVPGHHSGSIDGLRSFHGRRSPSEFCKKSLFCIFIFHVVSLKHCPAFELAKRVAFFKFTSLLNTNLECSCGPFHLCPWLP